MFEVYLIHFTRPYGHAQHYIGVTADLQQRTHDHRTNNGARLLQVVNGEGIPWRVVRTWQLETWDQARALERRAKRWHSGRRLCPLCDPQALQHLAEHSATEKENPTK